MDKNNPLLSVIVPIYNVEKYLPETLDSIINQTYANLEIILVDDGSPDNCPGICDEYARTDSRIKVIHKKNGGVSSARNDGIKIASGMWITFVDPDDWIDPDFYCRLLSGAEAEKADIIISDGMYKEYINKSERADSGIKNRCLYTNKDQLDMLTANVISSVSTDNKSIAPSPDNKLYRAELIRRNNIFFDDLLFAEDLLFNFIAFSKAAAILTVDICGYHYRQRKGSVSNRSINTPYLNSAISLIEKLHNNINNDSDPDIIKAINSRAIAIIIFFIKSLSEYGGINSYSQKSSIIKQLKENKYYREAITDHSDKYLAGKQRIVKKSLRLNTNLPLFILGSIYIIRKKGLKGYKLFD